MVGRGQKCVRQPAICVMMLLLDIVVCGRRPLRVNFESAMRIASFISLSIYLSLFLSLFLRMFVCLFIFTVVRRRNPRFLTERTLMQFRRPIHGSDKSENMVQC